jgi:hypothetical protein
MTRVSFTPAPSEVGMPRITATTPRGSPWGLPVAIFSDVAVVMALPFDNGSQAMWRRPGRAARAKPQDGPFADG